MNKEAENPFASAHVLWERLGIALNDVDRQRMEMFFARQQTLADPKRTTEPWMMPVMRRWRND